MMDEKVVTVWHMVRETRKASCCCRRGVRFALASQREPARQQHQHVLLHFNCTNHMTLL